MSQIKAKDIALVGACHGAGISGDKIERQCEARGGHMDFRRGVASNERVAP